MSFSTSAGLMMMQVVITSYSIHYTKLYEVMQPQEVIALGRLFKEGIYDANRVVVLTGSEVIKPAYYHTKLGAQVSSLLKNNVKA